MLRSVLCITTDKYLVRVLVVLCFSIVGPIPFLLTVIFWGVPIGKYGSTSYIGMTRKKNGGQ